MGIAASRIDLSWLPIVGSNPNRKDICSDPKVILITGASAGMGKEMALTMARRGHLVYGGARRTEKMKGLEDAGGRALRLDVTDSCSLEEAVKTILSEQGRIDVLVNNAGVACVGSVEDVPLQKYKDLFAVNFFGVVDLTQRVIPHMRKAGSGLIVNVSSVNGRIYRSLHSNYVASKHALEGWSDCLRVELSRFGIDVAIFEPGIIQSEIWSIYDDVTPKGSIYEPLRDLQEEMTKPHVPKGSDPSVVAECLVSAVEGHGKVKRRYVMGYLAHLLMFIRFGLGEAAADFFARLPTYQLQRRTLKEAALKKQQ